MLKRFFMHYFDMETYYCLRNDSLLNNGEKAGGVLRRLTASSAFLHCAIVTGVRLKVSTQDLSSENTS